MSIKKPTYIGCDKNTLIKDIPTIINGNNNENSRLFCSIFEYGNNNDIQYIKVPVVTKGVIKGNSGQFFNLYSNRISFSKESMMNDFKNVVINHNLSLNRFNNKNNDTSLYTHDSASILFEGNDSVEKKIKEIENNVNTINNTLINQEEKIQSIENSIKKIEQMIDRIVSNLNINNNLSETNNIESEKKDNEDLIKTINEPTSSYTYSSGHYKNNI